MEATVSNLSANLGKLMPQFATNERNEKLNTRNFMFLLIATLVFALIFATCFADVIPMSAEIEKPMEDTSPITWEHLIIFLISLALLGIFSMFLVPCAFGLFLASMANLPFINFGIIPIGYAFVSAVFGDTLARHPNEVMILMYMGLIILYLFAVELYYGTNSFKEFFLDLSVSALVVMVYQVFMVLYFDTTLTSDHALQWAPLMFLVSMILAKKINFEVPFKKNEG